jgi:hypothetical protein
VIIICLLKQKKDYWQNIDYLEAEWSFQDVVNFIDKVDYTIALLDKKNIEFISTNYKKRKQSCHYMKQITLYYKINSNTIELLDFEYIPRFRKFKTLKTLSPLSFQMKTLTSTFNTKHNTAPFSAIKLEDYKPAFIENIAAAKN